MSGEGSVTVDLSGQVALVTGGAKGIGKAIAEALLEAGCRVVVCGRNAPEALPSHDGRTAEFVACDVRVADQVRAMVDGLVERHGRLDIMVNNAGGSLMAEAATASPRREPRACAYTQVNSAPNRKICAE